MWISKFDFTKQHGHEKPQVSWHNNMCFSCPYTLVMEKNDRVSKKWFKKN
jgi:hypothetical protein